MDDSEEGARRTQFQQRLIKRFTELQRKGLSASDAASLSLKVEAGQLRAPVDVAELADAIEAGGGAGSGGGDRDGGANEPLSSISNLFSSAETLALSLARSSTASTGGAADSITSSNVVSAPLGGTGIRLDWALIDRLAKALDGSCSRESMRAAISRATELVHRLLKFDGQKHDVLIAQVFVVLWLMPWAADPSHEEFLTALCSELTSAPASLQQTFVNALSHVKPAHMATLVGEKLLQFIVLRLMSTAVLDDNIILAVKMLDLVFEANEQADRLVERSSFHCDAINQEEFDLRADYIRWKDGDFSFAAHSYLYEPAAKAELLRIENRAEMQHQMHDAVMLDMLSGAHISMPFFVLKLRTSLFFVRRHQLLNDAVLQVRQARSALKRPLRVKFIGEEGVDEGGVTKEFFQLLTGQLLNPAFGMFTMDADTRQLWFRASQHLDLLEEFRLVGSLLGLALYNSVILDVTFPAVLYKKLLGVAVGFDDLKELHPLVHANLAKLRSHTGSFDELALVFQVEQENEWGDSFELVDLVPGGGEVAVTRDNLEDYMQAYSRFLLVDSIAPQFDAFRAGFQQVCDGPAMSSLFFPEELELLVCGGRDLDFWALEKSSRVEGFEPDSDIIRWLWETVHAYSEEQQRRFLSFVTGSDRVPINGLGALDFVIHRNGDASDRLPTAHTCFNALMLSGGYKDKASLANALGVAIENAEGFGLQ